MAPVRTIVITGASQGIGAEIALALSAPGASLALVARNEAKLRDVGAGCRAAGARVLVVPCDVTVEKAVREMSQQVTDSLGLPDVVINNAGGFVPGSVADTETSVFRGQVEVNLLSAYMVTRAFLSGMTERGSGHFLFMGSVASIKGYPGGAAYCAAKHGLLGLARALREETKPSGLRVTTLLAGATLTPSWDGAGIPAERFMPASDIAIAVRCALEMSGRTVIEEILLRPQPGDI